MVSLLGYFNSLNCATGSGEQREGKAHTETNGRTGILPEEKAHLKLSLFFIKYTQIAATDYKILTA